MTLVSYGSEAPKPRQVSNGWVIPLGITSETDADGVTVYSGHEVVSATLFEHDIDAAIAAADDLPAGDYSEEKHVALELAAKIERLNQYPPSVELEYAQAQENAAAARQRSASTPEMQEYAAKVEAVNAEVPIPEAPTFMWSDVIEASGPSNNFRFDPADPQFLQLQVGDRIRRTEPFGVMPYDAELLTISTSDGVTTWSQSTTVSGASVPFKVSTYRP